MKRISLNKRLGNQSNRNVVNLFAGLTVYEYFLGTQPPFNTEISLLSRLNHFIHRIQEAEIDRYPAMCHTVMAIAMSGANSAEEILYGLLIEPIYRIQMEKEAKHHDHSLCAEGDSDGPDQDDHGGRELPTP